MHCVCCMELLADQIWTVAVFLAAMLEADVIPVLAGVAAHRGYFDPVFAVAIASFGALTGDCVWFYIGRSNTIRNSKFMTTTPIERRDSLSSRWKLADTRITRCLRNARCHDDVPGSARLGDWQICVG